MKASVIIPAYNEAGRLPQALEAILKQDWPDFEVIVIDNASTDGTAAVASRYPGVKVVREDRKGTMWACERGRQEATGEVIVRMDADCLPDLGWLSRGLKHFADERVAAVSGPYEYYDAPALFRASSLALQKAIYPAVNRALQATRRGAITIGGNSFIRASVLDKMGGFNTALLFYGDDTDTAIRASRFGRVVFDRRLVMKTADPGAQRFGGTSRAVKVFKYWRHFISVILSA